MRGAKNRIHQERIMEYLLQTALGLVNLEVPTIVAGWFVRVI